jgi:hypothetical protein
MHIHDFDPAQGQAFQGDVSIIPIPADIKIGTANEMRPVDGKLILQEGEMTGHHHHIAVIDRAPAAAVRAEAPASRKRTTKAVEDLIGDASAGRIAVPTARLYRDPSVAAEMQRRGILTRADLAVGCLIVEHGPMVVSHQEHDGIRLPVGKYLIGRQVESAGAEERVVAD